MNVLLFLKFLLIDSPNMFSFKTAEISPMMLLDRDKWQSDNGKVSPRLGIMKDGNDGMIASSCV